jgi:hypothetical protein
MDPESFEPAPYRSPLIVSGNQILLLKRISLGCFIRIVAELLFVGALRDKVESVRIPILRFSAAALRLLVK